MARLDFSATLMMLEEHPSKPGGIPKPRVLSPIGDHLATSAGHILVGWGQMMGAMQRYTNCLIAQNKSDPIRQKWLDFRQLQRRFSEEAAKAFGDAPTAAKLALETTNLANRAALVRKWLAHSPLSFAVENGLPVIVASVASKSGSWRTNVLRVSRLQSAHQEIEIAHGRIHQLALSSVEAVPYTSTERSLLQEIAGKGWTPHPILGKQ